MNHCMFSVITVFLFFTSCGSNEKSDAYGNFEATTVTISAKADGELLQFNVQEGQSLPAYAQVGLIDTAQLHLEKMQLKAQIKALDDKLQDAAPDVAVLIEDRSNLLRERNRTQRLYEQKAATEQQLDDYNGQIQLINQRIATTQKNISLANRAILAEREPLQAQINLIDKHLYDCRIINPFKGTVLTKFAEPHELVNQGSPLYKIADLSEVKLKAYTSALLLQKVKLNDQVTVLVDEAEDTYREYQGTVTWIASEAEFTPNTIETKEERVNLVYALEVAVNNDGTLKIGMPGEIVFNEPANE